jgi:DNA-binding LytR/AlgR family response regulator
MKNDGDPIYSVLIVEDEVPAREPLVDYLVARRELKLSGIARNGEEALSKLAGGEYDLVFMDINLPCLSGIEVLRQVKKPPYVIFTTAYENYAISAFDVGAVDFLLKPFTMERFDRSVEKFLNMTEAVIRKENSAHGSTDLGLAYRARGKHCILPYNDIVYACSRGRSSIIHTLSGSVEVPMILKDLELKIPAGLFIRIHKQHIVNIRFISEIEYYIGGQYLAHLKDEDESILTVGRKYAPYLKTRLNMV